MEISSKVPSLDRDCIEVQSARDRKVHSRHIVETMDPTFLCKVCPIRRDGFCANLEDEGGTFAENAIRTDLPAGRIVATTGEPLSHCGVLVSGILRKVRYGYDGRRQVMNLIFPGELIIGQHVSDEITLETATAARLCRLDRNTGARLAATSFRFRRLGYLQARRELERLRGITVLLGALSLEERIASFLSAAIHFMPWQPIPSGGGVLTLSLSRNDIADLLGTSLESISRITHRFNTLGLIHIRDPRHLEIPDPARLAGINGLDAAAWGVAERPASDARRNGSPYDKVECSEPSSRSWSEASSRSCSLGEVF